MDKLKKLGKYFTKGLQAGVLATALIAGNVSCSNSAGGDNTEFNGGYVGDGDQTSKWPSYYINTEFGGQRFVDTNEDWFDDNQDVKDEKFKKRYNNADQFINDKKEALQDLWSKKNNGSNLENKIYDALSNFNQGTTISSQIDNNYDAVAKVFAIIDGQNMQDSTYVDYYTFKAAYHKLAANAYTKAIGQYVNNTNDFPTLTETQGSVFTAELKYVENGKYNSNTFTFEQASATMKKSLATIATRNYANSELLNKFVELALYNESLYGLNDHALVAQVNNQDLKSNKRELMTFLNKIEKASTTSIQSMNDRTM